MNIERQVCSLDMAKRLKKLNIKQESLFYWIRMETSGNMDGYGLVFVSDIFQPMENLKEIYSAFTAEEIIKFTPLQVITEDKEPFNVFRLSIEPRVIVDKDNIIKIMQAIIYNQTTFSFDESFIFAPHLTDHHVMENTLADALAKNIIYLIEENLVMLMIQDKNIP